MKAGGPLDGDANPCRPRHFLPTAAAPGALVPQGKSLQLGRNRLVVTGAPGTIFGGATPCAPGTIFTGATPRRVRA